MAYVISFDGCGLAGRLQSRSPHLALALAEEAERNGCSNVAIKVPGGYAVSIDQFALEYCHA